MAATEHDSPRVAFATVDGSGRRLAYAVAGTGTPTVVLEAGLGCAMGEWRGLPGGLAADTRVIRYDRAGLGRSDPSPTPRSCRDMATDLHALLVVAAIPGPYLLVGHSLGGLTARLFAGCYPGEVAGMVLLDPTPSGFQQRQLALLPPARPGESAQLARIRGRLTRDYFAADGNRERVVLATCCAEVAATRGLGDRPLVLVTGDYTASWDPDFPAALSEGLERERRDSWRESLAISANSAHLIAERSGHFVHHDRPDVALGAIRRVLHAVRTGERLR